MTLELRFPRFEATPFPPHILIPLQYDNKLSGTVYGAEITANWQATKWWQLAAGYSWLQIDLEKDKSSVDTRSVKKQDDSPHHQFHVSSLVSLPHGFEFDTQLYYVDRLPGRNIPDYVRFDARLGWHVSDSVELSLCGQNLFGGGHLETVPAEGIQPTEAPRSVYGKVSWRF
jgi:iron complex outermembrane receptor protein